MPNISHSLAKTLQTIAPLSLAEDWDNVGLLLEPHQAREPSAEHPALLTIDLTPAVMREAVEIGASWIIAYHPPIFSGLKRLTLADPKTNMLLQAAHLGMTIYSPHTALDHVDGGVNDWLADGLIGDSGHKGTRSGIEIEPGHFSGRLITLDTPVPLSELTDRIKAHLGLDYLRLAPAGEHPITTIALCAGAGGSVITKAKADLYLTGEMRHHDVLAANTAGTHVILTEHTNTERGYLPILRDKLMAAHPDIEFRISTVDRDPLSIKV